MLRRKVHELSCNSHITSHTKNGDNIRSNHQPAGLFLGGGGGAFFTWRYMRRKAKAEAQQAEVETAKDKQEYYQRIIEDEVRDFYVTYNALEGTGYVHDIEI